jgi:hypothetical protein
MTRVKIDENNIFTALIAGSLALLALFAGAGFLVFSARFSLSIIAGGILAIVNFFWLRSVLVRSIQLHPGLAPRFTLVRYLARLTLVAVAAFYLIVYCRADIFGLLLGLSVLVINIIIFAFYMISAKGD